MVRHLVGLRLALLRGGLRRDPRRVVGLVLAACVALPAAALAAVGLAAVGPDPRLGPLLITYATSALAVGWALLPPLAFGVDETLDPERLQLLPIGPQRMASGLLVAGMLGVGPIATAVVLAGAAVGAARATGRVLLPAVAVVVQLLVCLVAARAVTTLLAGRLRASRGRDAVALAVPMVGLAVIMVAQLPALLEDLAAVVQLGEALGMATARVGGAAMLPTGWAAQAMLADDATVGLLWLVATAGVVGVLWALWVGGLDRELTRAAPALGGRAAPSARAARGLLDGVLGRLPDGRLTAGLAKEARHLWRVPQLRLHLLLFALTPTVGVVTIAWLVPELAGVGLQRITVGLGVVTALAGQNALGADREAVWIPVATDRIRTVDLAAKSLALLGPVLATLVVGSVGVGLAGPGLALVPAVVLGGLGLAGVALGVGMLASVLAPSPLPDSITGVWAGGPGTGMLTAIKQMAATLVQMVLLAPGVVLLVVGGHLPGQALLAAAGVAAWGAAAAAAGHLAAAAIATATAPELIDRMTRDG